MTLRQRVLAGVSQQLGRPNGPVGRVVGGLLNRGNRSVIVTAVESVDAHTGDTVADVGFGGGVGLGLLMDQVGRAGVVHGIEISTTMLAQARRRFRESVQDGRLHLHEATMGRLPLPADSVDAVVSTNTIYFVADLGAALAEFARVLRPRGRLALGVGDPDAMARMAFTKHGFTLRPINEITDHLHQAGFARVDDRRVGEGNEAFHILVCEQPSS